MEAQIRDYCARLRASETKRRRERFFSQVENDLREVLDTANAIVLEDERNELLRIFSRKSGAL